jgi:hypothetical protein
MQRTSYYIDPNTGCRVIENGRFRRCSAALSLAVHRIQTVVATVPGLLGFGSRIMTLQHRSANVGEQLRNLADEALRPGRGIDYDYFDLESYYNDASDVCLKVRVWRPGATLPETAIIPFT